MNLSYFAGRWITNSVSQSRVEKVKLLMAATPSEHDLPRLVQRSRVDYSTIPILQANIFF
jgi:hypothetical protein